ncbi:response regulator transcription factor [Microbacterium sp.]|uniref:helix-turn-helix transcriptional regulator n=1 Tax=Microbacterium sp. TaxID=51671 RepID=UPI003C734099
MGAPTPPDAALELARAVSSGDPDAVADVATRHIWPLFDRHYVQLTDAVRALPGRVLAQHPVLQLVHPLAPVLARSNEPFDAGRFAEMMRSRPEAEIDVLTMMQVISARMSGDIAGAMVYAGRLANRITRIHLVPAELAGQPIWMLHHQVGSTMLMAGHTRAALSHFATARQIGELTGSDDAVRSSLGRAALASAIRGSLDDADHALRSAAALPPASAAYQGAARGTEAVAAALVAVERQDAGAGSLVAQLEALDVADVVWPFLLLARGRLALSSLRPLDALEAVATTKSSHRVQIGSFAADAVTALTAEAHLALGDLPAARRAVDAGSSPGWLTLLARVRTAIHEGDLTHARSDARGLQEREGISPAHRVELLVLSAWADVLDGRELDAALAVRIARIVAGGEGRRIIASVPETVSTRVAQQLSKTEKGAFLSSLTGLVFPPQMPVRAALTPAELRVLRAIGEHTTASAVAAALHVSPNTVKSQLRSLYRKLGVATRADAIIEGSRLHLVRPDDRTHTGDDTSDRSAL